MRMKRDKETGELVPLTAEENAEIDLLDEQSRIRDLKNRIDSINSIRDRKIEESLVSFKGTAFQADEKSQILIDRALSRYKDGLPAGFAWWDVFNVEHPLTLAELAQLSDLMVDVGAYEMYVGKAVKDSCTGKTLAEVEAIVSAYEAS